MEANHLAEAVTAASHPEAGALSAIYVSGPLVLLSLSTRMRANHILTAGSLKTSLAQMNAWVGATKTGEVDSHCLRLLTIENDEYLTICKRKEH